MREEKVQLAKAVEHAKSANEAQVFVQVVAEGVQQQAHRQVASLVTRCLKAVFAEDAYEFRIEFQRKRGKTEANLYFVRDGKAIDPVDASGGGVVDLAGFALRLACLVLARPKRRRFLALDESFKHLSSEYRPKVAQLLEVLAKEMDIQFLLVTHSDELQVGKVVSLS